MLSELSLIDWAALLIAVTLLVITAAAAYLSRGGRRTSISSGPLTHVEYQHFPSRPPAHAASDNEPSFKAPPPPIMRRSEPPLIHQRSTPPEADAPFSPKIIDLTDRADNKPVAEAAKPTATQANEAEHANETVAERAARLRKARTTGTGKHAQKPRPVSESRTIHKAPQPAETLTFAGASGKLSVGMDTTAGFSVRAPGFFEDPIGRHEQRYWDGSGWTEHCKEGEERFSDPL